MRLWYPLGIGGDIELMKEKKPKILFLCTGNSCRSQMAEGWGRHFAGDMADVHSAGLFPAGVNPLAVDVMAEAGVDISGQYSKGFDSLEGLNPDIVITLCDHAQSLCPDYPGASRKEHWPTFDPSQTLGTREELLPLFRETRDELKGRISEYFSKLLPALDSSRKALT